MPQADTTLTERASNPLADTSPVGSMYEASQLFLACPFLEIFEGITEATFPWKRRCDRSVLKKATVLPIPEDVPHIEAMKHVDEKGFRFADEMFFFASYLQTPDHFRPIVCLGYILVLENQVYRPREHDEKPDDPYCLCIRNGRLEVEPYHQIWAPDYDVVVRPKF